MTDGKGAQGKDDSHVITGSMALNGGAGQCCTML